VRVESTERERSAKKREATYFLKLGAGYAKNAGIEFPSGVFSSKRLKQFLWVRNFLQHSPPVKKAVGVRNEPLKVVSRKLADVLVVTVVVRSESVAVLTSK
jgi:hypothetical protein